MKSIRNNARIAGLFYLALILSGIFSLLYVPSELIVWDSALETQQNILANETLFKAGILGDIVMYLTFMFLSIALYKLLKQVNNIMAISMVVLVLISVAMSFSNLVLKFDVVSLIDGADTLSSTELVKQSEQVISLLQSHSNGISLIQIFWGLWLFPLGYLVFKSGFLSKFFGVLLMIGCFGYLTDFIGYFLFPDSYSETIIPTLASLPHAAGEIGFCFWLLIVGVKKNAVNVVLKG
jgi:hypothetical protein